MTTRDLHAIVTMDENDFIRENDGLVHSIINKLPVERIKAETGLEREDLYSIGVMSMIRAKRNFNPDLGFQFSTYAVHKIRGEILRQVIVNGKVHVPRPIREAYTKIVKAGLINESDEVIADALNMTVKKVKHAKAFSLNVSSLQQTINEDAGDAIMEDWLTTEVSAADIAEDNLTIQEFLATLSPQEQFVWETYSKTNCGNQETIAKIVGISQVQVSRILTKIFAKAERFGERLRVGS